MCIQSTSVFLALGVPSYPQIYPQGKLGGAIGLGHSRSEQLSREKVAFDVVPAPFAILNPIVNEDG